MLSTFIIIHIVAGIMSAVLAWARIRDDKALGYDTGLKSLVMSQYIIPMLPIINIFSIVFSLIEYIS